jgi:hypothetical protein
VIRVTTATRSPRCASSAPTSSATCSRALQWHYEDRVLRHGNTTVVF